MATLLLEDLPPEVLRQLQQTSTASPSALPSHDTLDQLLTLCPRNASRIEAIAPARGEPVTDISPEYRGH